MKIMEGLRLRKTAAFMVVVITMMMMAKMGNGEELHYVGGGKTTWVPGINFSDWSSHEHFYKSDWLYFGFDKTRYNVLQVNKTSFENCVEKEFIKNITRGGRDVFQLTEDITYYFLSGGGYCFQGMKVSVSVVDDNRDTPITNHTAAAPVKNNATPSSAPITNFTRIQLLLIPTALVLTTFFFLKL